MNREALAHLVPHQLQRPVDDDLRRVRTCQRASRPLHPRPHLAVAGQRPHAPRENAPGGLALQQQLGGPGRRQGFGVLPLVIVDRALELVGRSG